MVRATRDLILVVLVHKAKLNQHTILTIQNFSDIGQLSSGKTQSLKTTGVGNEVGVKQGLKDESRGSIHDILQ